MLYNLLFPFADQFLIFNLFKYLTFRSGGAFLTAILINFIFMPKMICWLKLKQANGQPIREDGPKWHDKKAGTPTMGGLMILISVTISSFLWCDLTNPYVWIIMIVTLGFGLLGFTDDYSKLKKNNSKGVSGKRKLIAQALIALIAVSAIIYIAPNNIDHHIAIPFFKSLLINFGIFYIPFTLVVIIGASNAVNLTDGLDGLAIVPIMIAAGCFGLIAYFSGNVIYSNYLHINYTPGTGEMIVFCSAIVASSLGFLWYNAPPAAVFMGDTGSLSMGGALGTISVITKHEIVLAIIGGLFVVEAISVIIQVGSFKLTGKRVFKMAPIHHHFEHLGWSEPKIVIRFWIIAILLGILGLATLKLR